MKIKINILICSFLAVLLTSFTCLMHVKADASVINASSITSESWTVPSGDIILNMDVDKTFTYINVPKGNSLTIQGNHTLTIYYSSTAMPNDGKAIYALGNVTFKNGSAVNLIVERKNSSGNSNVYGIYQSNANDIVVEEGATVNFSLGPDATTKNTYCGISQYDDSSRLIVNGTLNIVSRETGINVKNIEIGESGEIHCDGARGDSLTTCFNTKNLTINGGKVYVNQGNTPLGNGSSVSGAFEINQGYFVSSSSASRKALAINADSFHLEQGTIVTQPKDYGTATFNQNSDLVAITDPQSPNNNQFATKVEIRYVKPEKIRILDPNGQTSFHQMFTRTGYPLSILCEPATAYSDVIWTVAKEAVAEIDANGVITGKQAGITTITATSAYDPEIKVNAVVHFVERNGYDFTGSAFSYDGDNPYYFGYLDIDGVEYNNMGYLRLKNVNITSDNKNIIKLSPPQYARNTTVSFYGTNTITSTYQSEDGAPGSIVSMGGSAGIRINLFEGAEVNLIDQGFNNGIENTSGDVIYIENRDSSERTKLSVNVNNTGLKGSAVYLQSYTGTAEDVTVNAKTGVQGSVDNSSGENTLTINARDYGITGHLTMGTELHAEVNADAVDSDDHGIGITGPVSSSGGNYADISSYAKITGSTQAIEYSNIQISSWGQYLAVTTPASYRKSDNTVIDDSTGQPAKTLILEPVVLNVIDGSGTGDYAVGQSVPVEAEERTGYSFSYWDVTNTNGWLITGRNTSNYANLFAAEADVKNPSVTVTIPEGRTKMAASYDLIKYNITYNLNGGTNNSSNPTSYYVTSDDITLLNPRRTRYAFLGWTDAENPYEPVKPYTIPKGSTGDKELTAWWQLESMKVDCAETHFFTERDYTFTYKLDPAEFVEDPGVTWSSSDNTIATVSNDGVVSAKKPGTVTITAYNAETDLRASKEITITDLYDFATDDTERGDLETDGFAWRKNNFDSTLTIKDLNLTRNNEYVIRIPDQAWIEFDGNNTLTSTYKSADGTPGNIIMVGESEDQYTISQIFPKAHGMNQPASTLTLQDNGYNNGINGSRTYIEPHQNYDSDYSRYYYPAGTVMINANAAGYYGRGNGDFYTGHNLDLTINAHDGIAACGYAQVWYEGNLTVNAENYGIDAANSVYLRDTSHAHITAIAKDSDDAGIAVRTRYIKDNNGTASLTGTDMCFFEGSTAAIEFIPEENPNYGMSAIVHPADYSIRDQFVFDNARNETAKQVVLGGEKYSVTYQLEGGSVDGYNPAMYSKYSDDFTLINPTKQGYIFTGWLDGDNTEKLSEVTVYHTDTLNRTFTATWQAETYQISYELNGGTADGNPESYTIEDDEIVLINPVREYYTFTGWSQAEGDEVTMIGVIPAGSSGDKLFTAHWTPVEYAINYDYDGGDAEGNPVSYNIETASFTFNHPVKNGYDFVGWMVDGELYPDYTVESGSHSEINAKAVWTPTVYSITYELDGGEFTKENPSTYTIESDEFVISDPSKDGYEFAGWILNDKNVGKSYTVPTGTTGNLVFTASWTYIIVPPEDFWLTTYELSLIKGQTGTIEYEFYPADTTDQTVQWTSSDETVATVDSNGTVTAVGAGTAYITGTSTANENLKDTCTVTVTELTVSFVTGTDAQIDSQHPSYGGLAEKPEDPSREGYEFAGWTADGTIYDFSKPVYTDITIKAEWSPIEYLISINTDGGTGTYPMVYTIESETIILEDPVKEGYLFLGWTGSNGDTPEKGVTIETGSTGTREYLAHWERLPDSITLSVGAVTLELGGTETAQLTATVLPSAAVNKTVIWESSAPEIAEVDQTGKVTAKSTGTALITATTVNGLTDTCTVTVEEKNVPVTYVRLDKTVLDLEVGQTYTFTPTIRPATATDKTLYWTSDHPEIAAVSQDGTVTAIAAGTAVITASSVSGVAASCTVNIKGPEIVGLTVTPEKAMLKVNGIAQLTAEVIPAGAADVTWTSSNENVATVDSNGVVTGHAAGKATITASAGEFTATAEITVASVFINSRSAALEDKIQARIYVYVPDAELETTYITTTFNGTSKTEYAKTMETAVRSGRTCRLVTVDTFAKQMRDDIVVKVHEEDGTPKYLEYEGEDVTDGYVFHVEDYVKSVEEKATDEKLIDLVRKMNWYGLYAQKQFNYNPVEFEEPAVITDFDDAVLSDYAVQNTGTAEGIKYTSGSLQLDADTGIKVNYTLTGAEDISTYTFTVDGEEVQPKLVSGKRYCVTFKGIPAKKLNEWHTITVTDMNGNTLTTKYSGLTYTYSVVSNAGAPDTLKDLCRSIYLYWEAAYNYFPSNNK